MCGLLSCYPSIVLPVCVKSSLSRADHISATGLLMRECYFRKGEQCDCGAELGVVFGQEVSGITGVNNIQGGALQC